MVLQKDEVMARLTEADVCRVYESLDDQRFTRPSEENWQIGSPFRDDSHSSMTMRMRDWLWNDGAIREAGDIFASIMRVRGCDYRSARAKVARMMGTPQPRGRAQAAVSPFVPR